MLLSSPFSSLLAAVEGFLAVFFACMATMYLGLLFITAFVTFIITMPSIMVALAAAESVVIGTRLVNQINKNNSKRLLELFSN
ncbi:hypothetical protein R6Q57_002947 [Mikania cordata]